MTYTIHVVNQIVYQVRLILIVNYYYYYFDIISYFTEYLIYNGNDKVLYLV